METKHCPYCDQDHPLKDFKPQRLRCKKCRNAERNLFRKSNPERTKEVALAHRERNREKYRLLARSFHREMRQKVMTILGGIKCVKCGCDRIELLEINHKDGGGAQEFKLKTKERGKTYNMETLMLDVMAGRRTTADLDVRCRPCNALHALELKFGSLPMTIEWRPNE